MMGSNSAKARAVPCHIDAEVEAGIDQRLPSSGNIQTGVGTPGQTASTAHGAEGNEPSNSIVNSGSGVPERDTSCQGTVNQTKPTEQDAQNSKVSAKTDLTNSNPQRSQSATNITIKTEEENGGENGSKEVSEEKIQAKIEEGKLLAKEVVENYTFDTHRDNPVVRKNLLELKKIYFSFSRLSPEKATKSRRELGTFFVDSGLVPILCEIVRDYLTTGWLNDDGKQDMKIFYRLYNAFIILFNYSDSTPAIPEACSAVPGFFEFIREQLVTFHKKLTSDETFPKTDDTMTRNLLGFTHNSSSVDSAYKRLRELDYTTILLPYLTVDVDRFKMSSILSLANLVDEEESALINTSVEAVKFLLVRLGKALQDSGRRNMGWSAKELAHGVAKLATNDNNKKMLVREGALPLLLKLSYVENEEEQQEAVKALWALSFDDENKDLIIQEPGLIDRLVQLEKSPGVEVRKAAQGVLWTLRYKLRDKQDYHNIGEELIEVRPDHSVEDSSGGKDDAEDVQHVMISYQWDSQDVLLKVRDQLRTRGYKTWMDVDYMGGSTLQAMAEAVENSAAVLICMSQRYKDSPNCRAEAEYAFQRRVPIIPLLMEDSYRPDGWLGILLGSKLFFDFSGKYSFESKLESLQKELGPKGLTGKQAVKGEGQAEVKGQGKQEVNKPRDEVDTGPVAVIPPVQSGVVAAAPPRGSLKRREVIKWGKKEVTAWLKEKSIEKPSLTSLSGEELLFLKELRREAPETFYSLLRKNLDLTSIQDMMKFVRALMDL
ncbi:uncharacterized protein LOC135464094 [Liolophura sinensis]|uniref:uncharacterized protein LOC135464094 n=1 Tax=Liolophura sinensis TaxID=3198878 RepID=UPI003158DDA2